MADGLLELMTRGLLGGDEDRVEGVAAAEVINNVDLDGQARVQVRLPWLPGVEPWARVAVGAAGDQTGFFLIPQVGDEVLVAFEHGDVRAPYVVGSLWNGVDRPPAPEATDAVTKVILKTTAGHVIEIDDLEQSIEIKTSSGQKVSLETDKIQIQAGSSKATLETAGKVAIEAATEIELKATTIKLQGTTVEVKAGADLSLQGGASASVQGAVVRIN
jgi:uncharacterized protein involved in type VI secretion and phage assembly